MLPGTAVDIFLCGGIGHWMWKHLVGLTPAAPGFAEVSLVPLIHDSVGPRSVGGQFLSPKGLIKSSWKLSAGTVSLSVMLNTSKVLQHWIKDTCRTGQQIKSFRARRFTSSFNNLLKTF